MSDIRRFFERYHGSDIKAAPREDRMILGAAPPGFAEFMGWAAGATFNEGLYRVHDKHSADIANRQVGNAFPEYAHRVGCFAFDWLGRQFSLDSQRSEGGEPLILIFEPGTGDVLEVPYNFLEFHTEELIDFSEAALLSDVFDEWKRENVDVVPLEFTQCVGFGRPLFLGGVDEFVNYEVVNTEVYWHVCGALLRGVADLPLGATISRIDIS
jgi:hypothetical protein